MEDIIIDDRRQISAKETKNRREMNRGRGKKRRFGGYLADLIVKTLLTAAFIAIDFTLFAEAGSYSLFTEIQTLTPEAVNIYGGILALSFILILLCSFSVFLENLIVTAAFTFLTASVINQFALFDKGSLLAGYFGSVATGDFLTLLNTRSHIIITAVAAVVFFIVLSRFRRSSQFYLLCLTLFICGGLVSEAYFNPVVKHFNIIYEAPDNAGKKDGKNFVYIGLPSLTSYNNLRDLKIAADPRTHNTTYNNTIQKALESMLGFYSANNFAFFTDAYVSSDNPFLNLIEVYNPQNPEAKPQEYTLDSVLLRSYWNFDRINTEPTLYLKENKIFETFKKSGFKINVYQSRGVESCYVNNGLNVNKCVLKENLPISLSDTTYSTLNKTLLLLHQWMESAAVLNNFNLFYEGVRFVDNSGLGGVSFSTKDFYVLNSPKAFDVLAQDIASGKGDNAYFAIIDLPSNLYAYDEMCKMKDPAQWLSASNNPDFRNNNQQNKKEAYAEQITCLYGLLEKFMQKLTMEGVLNNTVIVIQGLSNPEFIVRNHKPDDFLMKFKRTNQTNLAIFDPLKKTPRIETSVCAAPAILKSYLFKQYPCKEFEGLNLDDNMKRRIEQKSLKEKITEDLVDRSISQFKKWYGSWASYNMVDNIWETPEEKAAKQAEAQKVEKAPQAQEVKAEGKETAQKPLAEAMEETKGQDAASEEKAADKKAAEKDKSQSTESKEEQKQPQVKIQTTVTDKENTEEVIPPFLEEEPEPPAAKKTETKQPINPKDIPAMKKAAARAKAAQAAKAAKE